MPERYAGLDALSSTVLFVEMNLAKKDILREKVDEEGRGRKALGLRWRRRVAEVLRFAQDDNGGWRLPPAGRLSFTPFPAYIRKLRTVV
jgi:hypothetical protein